MKSLNFLGFDFGASGGRAIVGTLENGKLQLDELHRFSNDPVSLCGRLVWDIQRLFYEMKQALLKASRAGIELSGIGIDTWGVDFGLLDEHGELLGVPVHYRDSRTDDMMDAAFGVVPKAEIFERTGLAFMPFNTLYQLLAMKAQGDPKLDMARTLLFTPDLLAYFLTGEIATEYTIASTSQLIDPFKRDWARGLVARFGLPDGMLTRLQPAGTVRGRLLPDVAREVGMARVPVIAVGSHDTASAVAAVPAQTERFAYISSGTWSLLGAELPAPLISPEVMAANYTNEGGVCGATRLLKNIMGLWIIQECK
ncbi:MAG: rhamnulokinase, partial [Clostridiales bacterium]|nr:rhamnulokinase [Clostridiales bacterium]